MRVLVVSNFYPPTVFGGYELRCADTVDALEGMGHRCRVLTSRHGGPDARRDGEVLRELHSFWDLAHKPRDLSGYLDAIAEDALALKGQVEAFRPDVISCWNFMGIAHCLAHVVAASGVPALWHVDDNWMLREEPYWRLYGDPDKTRAATILAKGAHGDVDLAPPAESNPSCVFISADHRQQHVDAGMDVADHPVVHGGVDTDMFQGQVRPLPENGRARLLYSGSLTAVKGVDTLVKAMALLPEATARRCLLHLVGAGEPERTGELERLIAELGLEGRIKLLGPAERPDMPGIYRDHHALVFPSETREGFPLAILEAMACGLPVIATPEGGQREYLRHGENSLVVEPGRPHELAQAVARLLDDPQGTERMAATGRELVRKRFSLETMAARTESLLREVARDSGGGL